MSWKTHLIAELIFVCALCWQAHAELVTFKWNMEKKIYAEPNSDVVMGAMASQITSVSVIYSTVRSGADQR